MSHITYDTKLELSPFGLQNSGCICYFNALMQSLLGCTSLTHVLLRRKDVINKNNLTKMYNKMLIDLFEKKKTKQLKTAMVQKWGPIIWTEFVKILRSQGKKFGNGQEDSSEGFTWFIEALDHSAIDRLFRHRYSVKITCTKCNKVCSSKMDEPYIVEIYKTDVPTIESSEIKERWLKDPLNKWMCENKPPIDNGLSCKYCKTKSEKIQINSIRMVPEIIVLQFKKYDKKWNMSFPNELYFNGGSEPHKYKIISQVEHSGGINGGHYWSRSLRDKKVFMLNDSGVSPSKFSPAVETYMVFYHIM
jgi:ubiquitin C-terminal hydrolase